MRVQSTGSIRMKTGRSREIDGQLTAFVLSGGGSLGALQVGMLHALLEAGAVPTS
jgi:predicted acylesterase/phospholipase RssA